MTAAQSDAPSPKSLEEARKFLLQRFKKQGYFESDVEALAQALDRREAEVREEDARVAKELIESKHENCASCECYGPCIDEGEVVAKAILALIKPREGK